MTSDDRPLAGERGRSLASEGHPGLKSERIRVRGVVQGVGFRPTVARVAARHGLGGFVRNDGDGVVIALAGETEARDAFMDELMRTLPPLARVDDIERSPAPEDVPQAAFRIEESEATGAGTELPPDVAMCAACAEEVLDPYARRYRYPFTTCTECGPRFTIAKAFPFDRETTAMATFPLCPACETEYEDPADRRHHAQAMACFTCGPKATLRRADGRAFSQESLSMMDAVDAVGTLLQQGQIVAVKGIGSYHLCCDATNAEAVARLRARKRRPAKPFALMARDLDVLEKYVHVSEAERAALTGPAAPIVLLDRRAVAVGEDLVAPTPIAGPPPLDRVKPTRPVVEGVAPGQRTLGFMLPYSPIHLLMLKRVDRPIVCTSANLSDEPPVADATEAQERLHEVADWFLDHDRPIVHRVDDSVVRITEGATRTLRRARGLAPAAERLPPGLENAPRLLAVGGQFKSAFAITRGAEVVLSPHLGDLDHLAAFEAFAKTQSLLQDLYQHRPEALVVDRHPEYRATQWARDKAIADRIPLVEVGHHHAHVAAVMAEHAYPVDAPPVLGFALDGLGLGDDGEIWGGEVFYGHYARAERVGTFKPVTLIGGDRAAKQPWRNLLAHLCAEASWAEVQLNFGDLPIIERLAEKASAPLRQALATGAAGPTSSSCGRLFDAVAAAVGLCFDGIDYEAQAAIELEASISPEDLEAALAGERYPIGIPTHPDLDLPYLEPKGMWSAVLGDVFAGEPVGRISARFHVALADALVRMAELQRNRIGPVEAVVLSGGCFVNEVLLTQTVAGLERAGFTPLTPSRLPAHDGGLALGQAAIAAARLTRRGDDDSCA